MWSIEEPPIIYISFRLTFTNQNRNFKAQIIPTKAKRKGEQSYADTK